ncbi:MAG: adenine-specific methyltransferase EcoRI family protein [Oscillospiraceae bacterium]|nr:adenine-specific methyltransferase EcoRI family protein [Oscillospiraceae bacterium]
MAKNASFDRAKKAKQDEFYTQLTDIEKEMRYYRKHFKGKTVFCNCDDPYESNFFKYFVLNFNKLGLKKLIATCYETSPIMGTKLKYHTDSNGQISFLSDTGELEFEGNKRPYKAVVTTVRDTTGDGGIDMFDVAELFRSRENQLIELDGDGDFRSPECLKLLKESDVVVTNPPFSLFREYVSTLLEYNKNFIIIGSQNAITYKEFFPLLMQNKVWLGYGNGDMSFRVPDYFEPRETRFWIDEEGQKWRSLGNIAWFTNLDIRKRHEEMILVKRYSPELYPRYDNYDAIEVSKVADIPCDYAGLMGVPITFLDKYSPDQFEILGITLGNTVNYEMKTIYKNAVQHNKDGTTQGGSKVNTRAAILVKEKPVGTVYYTADNADGYLLSIYPRILICNKNPEQPKEVQA